MVWNLVNSASPVTTRVPPAKTMRDQLNACVPMVELRAAGITLPAASNDAPELIVPAAMALVTSVRSTLASVTAPGRLIRPAPCCSRLAPAIGWAVY